MLFSILRTPQKNLPSRQGRGVRGGGNKKEDVLGNFKNI